MPVTEFYGAVKYVLRAVVDSEERVATTRSALLSQIEFCSCTNDTMPQDESILRHL